MRLVRLLTVVAILAALLAPSPAAAGVDEASISGRVTNTDGLGVESACVALFVGGDLFDAAETSVEGGFEFTVPSGDYLLLAADCIFTDYFAEWYDDAHPADVAAATIISVAPGDDRVVAIVLANIFSDVEQGTSFTEHIIFIRDIGVTNGCGGDRYCPKDFVTREQMAAFIARLWRSFDFECPTGPMPFLDVAASSFAFDDIICIAALEITTGTSPTTYAPDEFVTREQMAAFLARFWRLETPCIPTIIAFVDVWKSSSFAYDDIRCIFGLKITTGTTPTTYSPDAFVTREQMAAFLSRLARAIEASAPS